MGLVSPARTQRTFVSTFLRGRGITATVVDARIVGHGVVQNAKDSIDILSRLCRSEFFLCSR